MQIVWISLCIALIIASVDAQRSFNLSKPVVSLEKKRPMTWLRPAEERRKLSIFPKKDLKFVVTPKTVIKDDAETTSPGPTKRPLMRKFIVHDKKEKGSWSFAPREPLMKTKRFTVTMAPPRLTEMRDSKQRDEIAEESKKVNTIINNSKARQEINKPQINKGNLMNASRNKNINVPNFKSFERIHKLNDKEIVNNKINVTIQSKNKLENSADAVSRDHDHESIVIHAKTDVNASKINKNKDEKEFDTVSQNIKLFKPSNIEEILSATMESRSSDLNDTILIDQKENRALNFDLEGSNGNIDGSSNIKLLEILMDNIMNDTANFNDDVKSYVDNSTTAPNQITTDLIEDIPIPQELYNETTQTSNQIETEYINSNVNSSDVYQVLGNGDIISTAKDELQNRNRDENATTSSQILKPAEEIIELSLPNNKETRNKQESIIGKYYTEKHTSEHDGSTNPLEITTHISKLLEMDLSELPTENFMENLDYSVTENTIYQTTFENGLSESDGVETTIEPLSTQFIGTDKVIDTVEIDELIPVTEVSNLLFNLSEESKEDLSNEYLYNTTNNSTSEEDSNESYLTDDSSSESVSDKSSNNTDEASNESNKEHNLSAEEISNDSNMATEEISNESIRDKSNNFTEDTLIDKSNNYTDEVSNESAIDKSIYLTNEDISNESNMAGEEISNESISDKSTNLTEEVSSDPTSNRSNNYTDEMSNESGVDKTNLTAEEISNESNMAGEETSNESTEKNNNLSEEISNSEALIDISLTTEDLSQEAVTDISDELIRSMPEAKSIAHILANRFKRSRNVIEEEIKATTVSGFKYTGREVRLGHDLSFKNINA